MTLNASECCHAIGCNCAGTELAETLQRVPAWVFPVVAIIPALIIFFYVWGYCKWSKK